MVVNPTNFLAGSGRPPLSLSSWEEARMLYMLKWKSARRYALCAAAMALCVADAPTASAQETIRIGLPTKTYYPTIIAETALRQGLFAKEGIKAELTIYRSGSESFEPMAAWRARLQPQLA